MWLSILDYRTAEIITKEVKEAVKFEVGNTVEILEGEHKGVKGTVSEIKEGLMNITIADDKIISVADFSNLNIQPIDMVEEPMEPEPIIEPDKEELGKKIGGQLK